MYMYVCNCAQVRSIGVYHVLHDFLQELDVGDHIELQVASIVVDPGTSLG